MMLNSLFQFVFQTGEFVSDQSTLLGISLDTIFTVTVTIVIFFLGYTIQQKIESSKEDKRLSELEDYIKNLTRILSVSAMQQSEALMTFADQVRERKEQHFRLTYVPGFNLKLLVEIPNQDLYKIFVSRPPGLMAEKAERFTGIRKRIDFLSELKGDLKPNFEKLLEENKNYQRDYSEHFVALNQMLEAEISRNMAANRSRESDPLISGIEDARLRWVNKERHGVRFQDMFICNDEYLADAKRVIASYFEDSRASAFLYHIKGCQQAVASCISIKDLYANGFSKKGENIQAALLELESLMEGKAV